MTHSKVFAAAGGLAALLFIASPVLAQHAGKHDQESRVKESDEEAPAGVAGQAAARDANGKLRALTAEEARALVAGISRWVDQSADGLKATYHANGTVSVFLDDRFQSVSLARVGSDGKVSTQCVGTLAEAERFLGQKAKAPAKPAAGVTALEEK